MSSSSSQAFSSVSSTTEKTSTSFVASSSDASRESTSSSASTLTNGSVELSTTSTSTSISSSTDEFISSSTSDAHLSDASFAETGGNSSAIGGIIGGVIGGILVCGIISGGVGYFIYRNRRNTDENEIALETVSTSAKSSYKNRMSMLMADGAINTSLIIPYSKLRLGKRIGGGGSGLVYKGRWQHTDVAIKQLHSVEFDPRAKVEFNREVSIMANLRHPNIVSLFGICFEPEFCIVMEFMNGGALYNLLHSDEELNWQLRWRMALDIGQGLAYLHEENIIHRDLKSLNVLLDNEKRAKLTDFGLSKQKTDTAGTMTKGAMGTARWMAPELLADDPQDAGYTKKSDVYSYGMILYELASRKVPFQEDENEMKVLRKITESRRPEIPEDSPRFFDSLISRCWEQQAGYRPDMDEAVQVLEAHSEEFTVEDVAVGPAIV